MSNIEGKTQSNNKKNEIINIVQNTLDDVYDQINNMIKDDIVQKIDKCNDYDYSNIKKIDAIVIPISDRQDNEFSSYEDLHNFINKKAVCALNSQKIEKLDDDEFIILCKYRINKTNNKDTVASTTILTNKGKILSVSFDSRNVLIYIFKNLNFFIPKKYIHIFTNITNYIAYPNLCAVLTYIKDNETVYSADIIEENKLLRSQYDKYLNDSKEFITLKEDFFKTYKEHIALDKERKLLNEEKEKLKLVKLKLEFEKAEMKNKLDLINSILNIDTNKILNID